MPFSHYTPFTIASGQVPSLQTNFHAVLNPTDARFKSVANGGHVYSANDIRPYLMPNYATALPYKIVPGSWNPATGKFEMWIRINALDGLNVYVATGDPALITDGSGNPFDSSVKLAAAYPDGTTLDVSDLTGQNNGTNHGATATTGKIGGGALTDGGNAPGPFKYIDHGIIYTGSPTQFSLNFWMNKNTAFAFEHALNMKANLFTFQAHLNPFDMTMFFSQGSNAISTSGTPFNNGTDYFCFCVYDGTQGTDSNRLKIYVNGVSQSLTGFAGMPTSLTAKDTDVLLVANPNGSGDNWYGGMIDELQFAVNVARSQDWVTTAYNNQNAPNTFWTIGTEVPLVNLMGQAFM